MVLALVLTLFFKSTDTNIPTNNEMAGSGTRDDPYIVRTVEHLKKINDDLDACYELGNNIDIGGQVWIPIYDKDNDKDFSGTFDGKGYTISNFVLEYDGDVALGIFSGIEKSGVVKNVVINPSVKSMVFECDGLTLGFLCGINLGTIENVKVEGDISIYCEDRNSENFVLVGGVVGENRGRMALVKNHCDIEIFGKYIVVGGATGLNESTGLMEVVQNAAHIKAHGSSNADVGAHVAGVSGLNLGVVRFACNAGIIYAEYGGNIGGLVALNLSTGKIEYSFNQGSVGGATASKNTKAIIGGLIESQRDSASISKSYNSGAVLGLNAFCAGVVGVSNEQSSIVDTYWLYSSKGTATNGEYQGHGYCKKCLSFSDLHNSSTLAVLNKGLKTPVFVIDDQYGIVFKWQIY